MDTESNIPTQETQSKQITVDVPENRVPEFYAWYAHFLADQRGRRGRGRGGHRGHHRHGHGPGHCRHQHAEHAESSTITPTPTDA